MSDDAMTLFQAMRPPNLAPSQDIRMAQSRPVQTIGGARDLHDLAMTPGSPSYAARIPRPPCFQCLEDHVPTQNYDHPWTPDPPPVHDEPVAASAVMRRPAPPQATYEVDVSAAPARRVALYVGRGDLYVVSVEQSPDWESVEGGTFRVEPAYVLGLVKLARALEVKIVDKTGGDLLMLEQEDVREHAQANGRSAQATGDRSPRQPGPATDWPQKGIPDSEEQPD